MVVLGVLLISSLPAAGAGPAKRAETRLIRYTPFNSNGSLKSGLRAAHRHGDCIGTSYRDPRKDTWRCFFSPNFGGYNIGDPCFENPILPNRVFCQPAPWIHKGVIIKTRLDRSAHQRIGHQIWALQTTTNRRCSFLSGASSTFGHLRANYGCSPNGVIWGYPRQRRPVWTAFFSRGPHPKRLHKVKVAVAWR